MRSFRKTKNLLKKLSSRKSWSTSSETEVGSSNSSYGSSRNNNNKSSDNKRRRGRRRRKQNRKENAIIAERTDKVKFRFTLTKKKVSSSTRWFTFSNNKKRGFLSSKSLESATDDTIKYRGKSDSSLSSSILDSVRVRPTTKTKRSSSSSLLLLSKEKKKQQQQKKKQQADDDELSIGDYTLASIGDYSNDKKKNSVKVFEEEYESSSEIGINSNFDGTRLLAAIKARSSKTQIKDDDDDVKATTEKLIRKELLRRSLATEEEDSNENVEEKDNHKLSVAEQIYAETEFLTYPIAPMKEIQFITHRRKSRSFDEKDEDECVIEIEDDDTPSLCYSDSDSDDSSSCSSSSSDEDENDIRKSFYYDGNDGDNNEEKFAAVLDDSTIESISSSSLSSSTSSPIKEENLVVDAIPSELVSSSSSSSSSSRNINETKETGDDDKKSADDTDNIEEEDVSLLRFYLLLMDPSALCFELLQLEAEEGMIVEDILDGIPDYIEKKILRKQNFTGLCNREGNELHHTACLSDIIIDNNNNNNNNRNNSNNKSNNNNVFIATPDNLTAKACAKLARPILSDQCVIDTLGGIDIGDSKNVSVAVKQDYATNYLGHPEIPKEIVIPFSVDTSLHQDTSFEDDDILNSSSENFIPEQGGSTTSLVPFRLKKGRDKPFICYDINNDAAREYQELLQAVIEESIPSSSSFSLTKEGGKSSITNTGRTSNSKSRSECSSSSSSQEREEELWKEFLQESNDILRGESMFSRLSNNNDDNDKIPTMILVQ